MRQVRLVTRVLVAGAVLAFPAVASADKTPPRASIAAKAELVSPELIVVHVRLKCEAGQTYSLVSDVFQGTWGLGVTGGQCTGGNQDVVISVYNGSGWQLDDAQAYLNISTSTDFEQEARSIRIEL